MKTQAATVSDYIAELPEDRRKALTTLRSLIRKTAPLAEESIRYGMASYTTGTMEIGLASQKNHMAVYVCDPEVVDAHREELGKLNCGKGCIRFKSLDELPLDVVRAIIEELVEKG